LGAAALGAVFTTAIWYLDAVAEAAVEAAVCL
jgi:hypothetical protein